jgi:hypothetical protein
VPRWHRNEASCGFAALDRLQRRDELLDVRRRLVSRLAELAPVREAPASQLPPGPTPLLAAAPRAVALGVARSALVISLVRHRSASVPANVWDPGIGEIQATRSSCLPNTKRREQVARHAYLVSCGHPTHDREPTTSRALVGAFPLKAHALGCCRVAVSAGSRR